MTANSWYRRTVFNYKGNREFTRTGYEAASARFVKDELEVDCSERHYMITGCNSGIGLETALEVARRGGVIHMVCRNQEAATKARSEIITTTGNDKIHLYILDLAKPRDVILWAQRFAAQHERLDVLVHNAGCMVHERRLDDDGVECNFAVNTLAVHILTITLMPLLQRSDEARVVTVSSAGLLCVRLDAHDLMHANLDPFSGTLVYSQNKRQQVVMTLWYAQHYTNVHFSSMHPGWADTAAVRNSIPQFYEMMKDNLRTPLQGADTVVWLAISKAALKHPGGLFFQDREPVSTHFPLAWTKSSIEEDDFLITNIQEIYTKICNKIFSPDGTVAHSLDTPAATSGTDKPPAPKEASEATTEHSHEEEKTAAEPATIPVLPPPPPPAEKAVPVKSEVLQEVAQIHAPPASSKREGDDAPEPSEDTKPGQSPPMERKTDATKGEDVNSRPSTPEKKEREDSSTPEDDVKATPEKTEEKDSTPEEDASSTTPSTPDKTEEKDTTPEKSEREDSTSTPSTPNKKEDSSSTPSTPNKKEEDTHAAADDDASSTASIEQHLPEP